MKDIDGDGNLDIINTGLEEGQVNILSGQGNGAFEARRQYVAGQAPVALAVADLGSPATLPDGTAVLGPADGHPDLVVAASGIPMAISLIGLPGIYLLPSVFDAQDRFTGFGAPVPLAPGLAPEDVHVADVNGDGTLDVVAVDRDGLRVIYLHAPAITANDTPARRATWDAWCISLEPTLTIVPGHEDAYYKLTVPTEAVAGAGDEVIDFSGLFQYAEGAGLDMEVRDSAGNLLGSGERFRVRAHQGEQLLLHVFGRADAQGTRGAGAYTLDIDVLPQVVLIEAQALLPGQGANPGGPTTKPLPSAAAASRSRSSTTPAPTSTWPAARRIPPQCGKQLRCCSARRCRPDRTASTFRRTCRPPHSARPRPGFSPAATPSLAIRWSRRRRAKSQTAAASTPPTWCWPPSAWAT